MKKKIVALGLIAGMLMTTAGCGNKYVTLGEYKNLEVEYSCSQTEVTDSDIEEKISTDLQEFAEKVTDKKYKAQNGDTVNIDYKGLKDGKAFEGGTAEGYDLKLGTNTFIDGFESGLVGCKIGEKRDLNLTFPENYNKSSLAGKAVVFKVTVNSITTAPKLEDLTDEFVAEKIEGFSTVKEYKESVKKELQEQLDENVAITKEDAAWAQVTSNAKMKEYPEEDVKELVSLMEERYTQYANSYGVELDDFIQQTGSTREEFDKQVEEGAKQEVASRLIAQAIADKEKISVSDDEYKQGVKDYMEQYQYSSEEDLLKDVPEETIRIELLREKVKKFVVENSKLTLKAATEENTAESTEDTAK